MLLSPLCYKGYCTQELLMSFCSNHVPYVPDFQSQDQCSGVLGLSVVPHDQMSFQQEACEQMSFQWEGLLVGVHYVFTPWVGFQQPPPPPPSPPPLPTPPSVRSRQAHQRCRQSWWHRCHCWRHKSRQRHCGLGNNCLTQGHVGIIGRNFMAGEMLEGGHMGL